MKYPQNVRSVSVVVYMLFVLSVMLSIGVNAQALYKVDPGLRPTLTNYTFTAVPQAGNYWSEINKWSPSYLGDNIPAGDTVLVNTPYTNTFVNIHLTVDGTLSTAPTTNPNFIFYLIPTSSLTIRNGGIFVNDGAFEPKGNYFHVQAGGTVVNNGTMNAEGLVLEPGSSLTNNSPNGVFNFKGTSMTGDLMNTSGTVETNSPIDKINGNFNNGSGRFVVYDLRDAPRPGHGILNVTGTATLSGTFDYQRLSYNPILGDQFTIVSAANRVGMFSNRSVSLGNGRFANVYYTATTAFIRIENAPTAAAASISGRSLTANGRGITNAMVTLTDPSGLVATTITTRLGAFRFENVPTGVSYVVAVSSRRFSFDSQVIQVVDNISDLTFIASER